MPSLYRALSSQRTSGEEKKHHRDDRRTPQNVPYVVDNLWEWARPDGMPSRRGCAYASPTPELARENAGNGPLDVFQLVDIAPDSILVQIPPSDAKRHSDIESDKDKKKLGLRSILLELLKEHYFKKDQGMPADQKLNDEQKIELRDAVGWAGLPFATKMEAAPLFLPAVNPDELQALLGPGGPLESIASKLKGAVGIWKEAKLVNLAASELPYPDGEVFYSADTKLKKVLVPMDVAL